MGRDDGYSDSEEDLRFDPPPLPAPDAAVVVPVAPSGDVVEHAFSVDAPGAVLHFQIVQLCEQLYVWVGAGGGAGGGPAPVHGEMSMAIKTRMSDTPTVTTLIGGGGGGGGGEGVGMTDCVSNQMAHRLAKRTGKCVVASCNIPSDLAMLQVFAERTLLDKLKELEL